MQSSDGTKLHSHRCIRCGEEFSCQTPGLCDAHYDVLPVIITLGPDGRPRITEHCPHLAPKLTAPADLEDTPIGKHGPYGTHTAVDGAPADPPAAPPREEPTP